jgi:hypothetical protein
MNHAPEAAGMRLFAALLAAAAVSAGAVTLPALFGGGQGSVGIIGVAAFLFALMHALVLGAPLLSVLMHRGRLRWATVLPCAGLIAMLPSLCVALFGSGRTRPLAELCGAALALFIIGVIGGAAFMLVWSRGRRAHLGQP